MARVVTWIACAAVLGCTGAEEPAAEASPASPASRAAVEVPAAPAEHDDPSYAPETRSLRLARSVAVHLEPHGESPRVGTIARDIRARWQGVAPGPGCDDDWVELEPRGWVCGTYLEPSERAPWGIELPRVGRGEVVPGVFGQVTRQGAATYPKEALGVTPARVLQGAVKVRREGEAEAADGTRYWRIGRDEYIAADAIRPLAPSTWHGVRLGADTGWSLPLGFAFSDAARGRRPVAVYETATLERVVDRLSPRAPVSILDRVDGAVRIGAARWLRAADVRIADLAEPPPRTGDRERWVDVDLDAQLLIAYEGRAPVYATLIASGSRKYPSETGVFRVFAKLAETDMNGQMGDEAPYSVATVPWTQFYARDLALHTAYWHDKFGDPRSHGCINLAPVDARFLYFWSEPSVPAGWSAVFGMVERPGSIVRVRSASAREPEFKGYARRIFEARGTTASAVSP